jgi:purine-cytosine permease-like protein
MSTGASSLYGTGLDFSSVFPRFNRVQATLFIGILAIAFIFAGRFAFNLVQSISTFATLIVTCTAPWMVVMIIGFITRRGWYDADALQVFNRRQTGGRYWFNHGWNLRGMTAWLVSAAAGLSLVNMPGQFQGPLGNLAGGVDISLPASLALAAVLYLGLLWIFPEPRGVFPAAGPRWIPSKDTPVPPVIDAAGKTVTPGTPEAATPGLPGDRDTELVGQR